MRKLICLLGGPNAPLEDKNQCYTWQVIPFCSKSKSSSSFQSTLSISVPCLLEKPILLSNPFFSHSLECFHCSGSTNNCDMFLSWKNKIFSLLEFLTVYIYIYFAVADLPWWEWIPLAFDILCFIVILFVPVEENKKFIKKEGKMDCKAIVLLCCVVEDYWQRKKKQSHKYFYIKKKTFTMFLLKLSKHSTNVWGKVHILCKNKEIKMTLKGSCPRISHIPLALAAS